MTRLVIFAALVSMMLGSACDTGSRPPRIGSPAKEFRVQDSDRTVQLNQFRGQVVVLNFWATWCTPCNQELPSLIAMQDRTRAKGVTVVGVSIDVDGDAYHRFLKARNINFLTVRDPEQKVAEIYGTSGWPETYIIDRQGVLRRKVIGPIDWTSPEMMGFLTRL